MILCIPLVVLYLLAISSVAFSKNYTFEGLLFTVVFFLFLFSIIALCMQIPFAYMKPAYVQAGKFFESMKKGIMMAKENFWNSVIIVLFIFIIGFIITSPILIVTLNDMNDIIGRGIYSTSLSQKHFPAWKAILPSLQLLVIDTLTACAFTHLYLTFKKKNEASLSSQ